ncbi:MAG TPA: tRNA (adenosine(37)-N6)-dimethylallyltransferase MiaA [Actinomycetota bacterium]|nr:tRNA (adenosine(37)-N6)-dimethylallyltransferase MiaA [Actinomycetota bacterium]
MATEAPLAIVGPTASGKTQVAIAVARAIGAEIVSVDSMLLYRGMDVGTAKPTAEERGGVPHHLIDVAEPSEAFSVARYQRLALEAVRRARERGRSALLVGGSGLYFRAVVDELAFPGTDPRTRAALEAEAAAVGAAALHARLTDLDPVAAGRIQPENVRRTVRALEVAAVTGRPFSSFARAWERFPPDHVRAAGIEIARPVLAERIRRRVDAMLEHGLLDEVATLVRNGFGAWLTASQAIGYAEFARHLAGEITLAEAVEGTVRRTKELARRQMVWFRRDPRIRWFRAGADGAGELTDRLVGYLDG